MYLYTESYASKRSRGEGRTKARATEQPFLCIHLPIRLGETCGKRLHCIPTGKRDYPDTSKIKAVARVFLLETAQEAYTHTTELVVRTTHERSLWSQEFIILTEKTPDQKSACVFVYIFFSCTHVCIYPYFYAYIYTSVPISLRDKRITGKAFTGTQS